MPPGVCASRTITPPGVGLIRRDRNSSDPRDGHVALETQPSKGYGACHGPPEASLLSGLADVARIVGIRLPRIHQARLDLIVGGLEKSNFRPQRSLFLATKCHKS